MFWYNLFIYVIILILVTSVLDNITYVKRLQITKKKKKSQSDMNDE